jgi:hypothetical protein
MSFLWSLVYLAAMAIVALSLQSGYLLAGDGFFLAATIVAVFTGHWAVSADAPHEEAPVATTQYASASVSYAICLAIAGLVTVQAIAAI